MDNEPFAAIRQPRGRFIARTLPPHDGVAGTALGSLLLRHCPGSENTCRTCHTCYSAPIFMSGFELAMPFIFDWYLAITQAWVPLVIQVADITGPIGVTWLIMMVNGALFDAFQAKRNNKPLPRRSLAAATATLVLALCYGAVRIHQVTETRDAASQDVSRPRPGEHRNFP